MNFRVCADQALHQGVGGTPPEDDDDVAEEVRCGGDLGPEFVEVPVRVCDGTRYCSSDHTGFEFDGCVLTAHPLPTSAEAWAVLNNKFKQDQFDNHTPNKKRFVYYYYYATCVYEMYDHRGCLPECVKHAIRFRHPNQVCQCATPGACICGEGYGPYSEVMPDRGDDDTHDDYDGVASQGTISSSDSEGNMGGDEEGGSESGLMDTDHSNS